MRYLDEYRGADAARRYARLIAETVSRPWTVMEVCGGQTHSILRHGVDALLPADLTLLHGPGCPVCVTPAEIIDTALAIAAQPGVILCSFGDMLRVPGTREDLLAVKARGGDVRMVYSSLDALECARRHPDHRVVFFAVGFETTAPTTAFAVHRAATEGLENFSVLMAHVRVPPALRALLESPDSHIDAFLAAGHVCTVMGTEEYAPIVTAYRVPIVVTGFEPVDLLQGIHMAVAQLESGRAELQNQYARCVSAGGNATAQALMRDVFRIVSRPWRGMGDIAGGGLALAPGYRRFDALEQFAALDVAVPATAGTQCISGDVLRGVKRPPQCPAFGTACTPEHPLGATMVSGEGACSAYYRYRRLHADAGAAG